MSDSQQPDVQVRHRPETQRYEALVDERVLGVVEYEHEGDGVVLTHTEVADEAEGLGVASALVRGTLDDLRSGGRPVVARCPFVASWIEKHPDYEDLLAS